MKVLEGGWKSFYEEIEPSQRSKILETLKDSDFYEFANYYYLKRYDSINGREIDKYLAVCLELSINYRATVFNKSKVKKRLITKLEDIGLKEDIDELYKKALYWEIRNAIKRFIYVSTTGSARRSLLGFVKMSEKAKLKELNKSLDEISIGISTKFDIDKEAALWNEAVADERNLL